MTDRDRWIIRRSVHATDSASGAVSALLRRAADYLDELGPTCVEDVVLQRETTPDGEALALTVNFDRARMTVDLDYLDPRMAATFDGDAAPRDEFEFMVSLAEELDAHTILDVGCGTGRLARRLATPGRHVIGIEPAPAMLEVARTTPGAERVQWILGDATALGTPDADLVVMTGNVALVFLSNAEWSAALRAIHAALRPGGHLAFGTLNPADRAWERWNQGGTRTEATWAARTEVIGTQDGLVDAVGHIVFPDTGESLDASSRYRFRTLAELTTSLIHAGFTAERTYGDWQAGLMTDQSPEIVLVAKRT